MSKLLSHLSDLNNELKITAQEMRLVSRQIHTECWQPDAGEAYRFQIRKKAYRYVELLEEDGYNRLFVRAVDDSYLIMNVVGAGVIHYYTEPKGYLHREDDE